MNALRLVVLFGLVALTGCASASDAQSAAEAEIHGLVKSWSAAGQAKDAAKFTSVYAEDAVVMLEGAPDLRGLDAIRAGIAGMMQDPNFSLSFVAKDVVVSSSCDLAYETGSYSMSMSGPDGAATQDRGSYVVVWRRQPDGAWKVVVDAPISDPRD